MIDMQKLDASKIATPSMPPIYVVHAKRWGDYEKHSYIVLATNNLDEAIKAANDCEIGRGGEYGCEITCFNCGKKTIIRMPYDDREIFSLEKLS